VNGTTKTLERPPATAGPRGPRAPGRETTFDRSSGDGPGANTAAANPARVGVWLFVIAVTILFAAFTNAYLSRRAAADWQVGPLLPILWVNTVVLVLSSLALEYARAHGSREDAAGARLGLGAATALGTAFLIGQVVAWRALAAAGIFMASSPHSAYFYLLTGMHGLHLTGGVGGLFYALWKVHREPAAAQVVLGPTAIYWHFVDVLWLYLFFILFWQ